MWATSQVRHVRNERGLCERKSLPISRKNKHLDQHKSRCIMPRISPNNLSYSPFSLNGESDE